MRVRFDQGHNSIGGLGELRPGELLKSVGAYYRPNDIRLWKQNGRSLFGTTASGARTDVALCQFDAGNDYLLALSGTTLYKSTPGVTGTFTALATGLTTGGSLITAHALDRHYLVDGVNFNRVLESDGTVRRMGMTAQPTAPIVAAEAPVAGDARPLVTVTNSGWTNAPFAYDASFNTYAHAVLSAPGTSTLVLGGWASNTTALRRLSLYYRLAGTTPTNIPEGGGQGGLGGTGAGVGADVQGGYTVVIKFEKSEDSGVTWTTIKNEIRNAPMPKAGIIQASVTANSNLVQVRATLTYTSGTSQAQFSWFDARIFSGTPASPWTAPDGGFLGFQYCLTEWDDTHGNPGPPGSYSAVVILDGTTHTQVRVTLPSTPANTAATHWRIYRTPDGGAVPNQLGWLADVPITDTVFLDDFSTFAPDEQPSPPLPMIGIEFQGETDYYPRDTPAPRLSFIWFYKGGLLGISPDSPRTLFMGLPSRPESWPAVNVISSFPLPEHDQLVAGATCGDTAIVGAQGVMIALDDVPRVSRGVFNAAEARPLAGQPGLVGRRAICSFSVAGEARVAWISRYGIHETNGTLSRKLTDDIDWQGRVSTVDLATAVLAWDPSRQVLIFAYTGINPTDESFTPAIDTDGNPVAVDTRFALLHMADAKSTTGLPKVTWGHAGRISSIVAGEVAATRYLWSGHATDGRVYVENRGGADASLSFNATGAWPLDVLTDRLYADDDDAWEVGRGRLSHSDSGTTQAVTIECRTGRDSSANEQVRTKVVTLDRDRANELFFGLAGEWVQFRLRHTGTARFAINELSLPDAVTQDRVGDMLVP